MKFEAPEILITKFNFDDVITTSTSAPEASTSENELPTQPGEWD